MDCVLYKGRGGGGGGRDGDGSGADEDGGAVAGWEDVECGGGEEGGDGEGGAGCGDLRYIKTSIVKVDLGVSWIKFDIELRTRGINWSQAIQSPAFSLCRHSR